MGRFTAIVRASAANAVVSYAAPLNPTLAAVMRFIPWELS